MKDETQVARKARAAKLHEQIKNLKEDQRDSGSTKPDVAADIVETPAEFIRKRMSELNKKKTKTK